MVPSPRRAVAAMGEFLGMQETGHTRNGTCELLLQEVLSEVGQP